MDTVQFINKILPARDNYVLFIAHANRKWNEAYSSLTEVCDAIKKYDSSQATVYFAVGKYNNNIEINPTTGKSIVKRKKEYATFFRTLCCDIDVGSTQKYTTQKEAAKALLLACDAMRLPRPMLVNSGYGLHAYWPLLEDISADVWEAVSIKLHAALEAHNVHIDKTKIHDRSMVLRPVGTHNKKLTADWKLVKLVYDQPAHRIEDLLAVLDKYAATVKPRAKVHSSLLDAVLTSEATLVLDDLRKCKQIEALLASGGATDINGHEVKEPLWRASLGIAKYCVDQKDAIIQLAGKHPEFNLEANLKKLDGWHGTGPTTCTTFEQLCPEGCAACEYKGKLTSPALLSNGIGAIQVVDPVTHQQTDIKLPPRYSIKRGWLYYTPPGSEESVLVAPYLLWVVDRLTDVEEQKSTAKVAVKFPIEGTKIIDVDISAIAAGGVELSKELALKQIYLSGDVRPLRQYLMTYLKELQAVSAAKLYYKHYGWQKDGSFLGSTGLITADSSDKDVVLDQLIKDYSEFICSKGDLKTWTKATKLFDHDTLTYHGFVFLIMGGSILLKGSGLESMLVNMYSPNSGTGKTLTARFGLSIWGKPSRLMRTVNDTDNALYKRFGSLNSLGAYIDEITTMDTERLRNFVFTIPEGRERDRVKRTADRFNEAAHWNMPIFSSSNRDIYEALASRAVSEAEKMRVLQLPFDRVPLFERSGTKIGYTLSTLLEQNYGLAGPMVARRVLELGGPEAVYAKAREAFHKRFDFEFSGQERYWHAAFVIAYGLWKIAKSLNLLDFDGEKCIERALKHLFEIRAIATNRYEDGLDAIMQYLTERADKIVHWREIRNKHEIKSFPIEPVPRLAVARSELAYDDKGTLLGGNITISRTAFREWCHTTGNDYTSIKRSLINLGISVQDGKRRCLYKGLNGYSIVGQVYSLVLDVNSHPRLIEACANHAFSSLEITPRMQLVRG